jgi:hypothetical protein
VYYDKKTDRIPEFFVGTNVTLTAKFWAPGVMPTLLQRGTSEPEWWATRDLWTATMPQLSRSPAHVYDLEFPTVAGLTEKSFCDSLNSWDETWGPLMRYGNPMKLSPDELTYVVGFNFWKQTFGVELSKEDMDTIVEFQVTFGGLQAAWASLGEIAADSLAARGIEMQKKIEAKVMEGKWSKEFLEEAKKRGLDGPGELRSLLVSFIVAGFSSPGTTFFASHVIAFIRKSPKNLELYMKDPEAFQLEVVRLKGAGGANSNFHVQKTTQWTLPSGKKVLEKVGSCSMTNNLIASHDPNVWGGPSKDQKYADTFLPGRENREQVISWMSELQDIRKCPNMTGCDSAPRFCPGTELTLRLSRQTADFYIEKCTARSAKKDEM